MSWELASFLILGGVLLAGFAWYERSRPPSQVVALVAALAALAIAGRIAFAAFPNVKPTTDIVILAGYALGPGPGFAVGGLAALVSNFWFGQGPWTPWQMAGWGLCGVFGAALSLSGREIGRFTLAAACGLAGLAYGALLNFSLMATYGGELSLQRFLALESRAIPFDLAHAAGNVVFALIAGPAMLRMLVRYRDRFEWRVRTPALVGTILAALLLVSALPAQADAATGQKGAVNWLVSAQNSDGGWGSSPGSDSSSSITGWVMLGLEAAGRNPLDVAKGGRNPVDYLRSTVGELSSSGDFARTILALEGAGVDTRAFGGNDLPSALLKRRRGNGSWEGWPGSTAFAVLALKAAGETGGLDRSISWLSSVQNKDGGWGDEPGSPSTPDGTGAVMQAMAGSKVAEKGLSFLRKAQRSSGGFALGNTGSANSQSTAWAVQGMIAVGANPASISSGGTTARGYLLGRQAADGHFTYSSSSNQTPVWVTGQVLPAVAGQAFPISPPPREPPPAPIVPKPEEAPAPAPLPPPAVPSIPGGVPPSSSGGGGAGSGVGGTAPPISPPGTVPGLGVPLPTAPEGEEPETTTSGKPFEASPPPAPKPWVPAGVGLGTGGLALGGVIFLGRRFGW
jgi:Squalene-hopene cyclase C-terminal domain/Prenyltransferase and squalene oxidase repeat